MAERSRVALVLLSIAASLLSACEGGGSGGGADGPVDCAAYTSDAADPPGPCGTLRDSLLPELTGPYCVGTIWEQWLDESREETFTPADPADRRELMVQIWYPTDPDARGTAAAYVGPSVADWVRVKKLLTDPPFPEDWPSRFLPRAIQDDPFAAGKKRFPVLVFSPGLTINEELYTSFLEDLASHGYVVAAIDHPYFSGLTVFPDGREIEASHHYYAPWFRMATPIEAADQRFVLDRLTAISQGEGGERRFACRLDLEKVGVFGHSFGASAAAEVCLLDDRFRAGVDMDGSVWGQALRHGSDRPFLMLLGENSFEQDATMRLFWNRLRGPRWRGEIKGALHGDFSDIGLLYEAFLSGPAPQDFQLGSIGGARAVRIVGRTLNAFFDIHLKGADPGPYWDELRTFEEVAWTTQ